MKKVKECPVCDSKNIEICKGIRPIEVPFAATVYQKHGWCQCKSKDCGAPIRIWTESAKVVKKRIFKSAKDSIPTLLKHINDCGFCDSRIERALYLKEGIISKWKKKKKITPEVIALVRLLYINPDLVRISEERFD